MSKAAEKAPRRISQSEYAVRSAGRSLRESSRALGARGGEWLRLGARTIGPVLAVISPTGRLVFAVTVVSYIVAVVFGWAEFGYIAATGAAALLLACLFLVGRVSYRVNVTLNPTRVVAGERALGELRVANSGPKALQVTRMELPVGDGTAEFMIPPLAPQAEHEQLFAVPTHKRAVIVAGPALSIRGDQLGLLRRTVRWGDPVELFVHPVTTRLSPSAAGLVRDLEGEVSATITDNDISFHALRAYEPGDALRNVHWRTSARTGHLMVRQFEETRRSQLALLHVADEDAYASADEFELAVSVTASLAVQVIRDGTHVAVVSEDLALRTATPTSVLDDSCRIEPISSRHPSMRAFARDATRRLPAPSVVMAVSGSATKLTEFRSLQTLFGLGVKVVAVQVSFGAKSRLSTVAGMSLISVGSLTDLPGLFRRWSK